MTSPTARSRRSGDTRIEPLSSGRDTNDLYGCEANRRSRRDEVEIKSRSEILLMREAGLVVARTLDKLRQAVQPGMTTKDLDEIAESSIRGEGAIPSFLNYGGHMGQPGFQGSICASVNEEIVH